MKRFIVPLILILIHCSTALVAQKPDSIRIIPANPTPYDSITAIFYGHLTSGGVSITRIVYDAAYYPSVLRADVFGQLCFGYPVVTSFTLEHTFPPMPEGSLTLCCYTYQDTTSDPGPYNQCLTTSVFVPLWDTCEHFIVTEIREMDNYVNYCKHLNNPVDNGALIIEFVPTVLGHNHKLSLYDMSGRLVDEITIRPASIIERIQLGFVAKGIFILEILSELEQPLFSSPHS